MTILDMRVYEDMPTMERMRSRKAKGKEKEMSPKRALHGYGERMNILNSGVLRWTPTEAQLKADPEFAKALRWIKAAKKGF